MQRHNRMRAGAVQLNLVSMIDVFAVLVFFLLLSASLAADRLATLGLDLPTDSPPKIETTPPKVLTVTVHRDGKLELADRNGTLTQIPGTTEGRDLKTLADHLLAIKQADPKEETITLLLEPDVPYDALVQVMDTARTAPGEAIFENGSHDMFPLISIGDAPTAQAGAP